MLWENLCQGDSAPPEGKYGVSYIVNSRKKHSEGYLCCEDLVPKCFDLRHISKMCLV